MDFTQDFKPLQREIVDLFTETFAASEGAKEGALIGGLARDLMTGTAEEDLYVFAARETGLVVGCIFFSRQAYARADRVVFLLAPVAVATDRQGQGVGQALIQHGLKVLKADGVDVAVTYGDPGFYSRVGFALVTEADLPAPFALAHPEGWLAQSLSADHLTPLKGPARCVPAINDPAFW